MRCNQRHPPGIEIYRKGVISVFEVDGAVSTVSVLWLTRFMIHCAEQCCCGLGILSEIVLIC